MIQITKPPLTFLVYLCLQIQQEEVFGVQQSSLMVVELIVMDPDTATPRLMGRDTIMLQAILKVRHVLFLIPV